MKWHSFGSRIVAVRIPDSPSSTSTRLDRGDLLAWVVLALLTGAAIWGIQSHTDPRFLTDPIGNDVWFEGDQPTVADRMLHRWSDQSRNARHPLFPLLGTMPVYAFTALGVPQFIALRLTVIAFGLLWSGTVYLLMRSITTSRAQALVFTALAHVTAAAMFWLPVPETYSLGSVSVMAVLALGAWDPFGRRVGAWYVGAAAFSLAVTTTNWLTGLAVLATRHPWRRALQIAANSLCVVVVLWAIQRAIFPTAEFFIGSGIQRRFILPRGIDGIPAVLRTLFVHSIVMPQIGMVREPKWGWIMSVQEAGVGSSGPLGVAATVVWGALLLLGSLALATRAHPMRAPLALALGGHAIVYVVYGDETFLYTLLVAPVLVAVAAVGANTRLRSLVLSLAVILTVLLAVNNWAQFSRAMHFFDTAYPSFSACTGSLRDARLAGHQAAIPPVIANSTQVTTRVGTSAPCTP
jgi:hypothetical protein